MLVSLALLTAFRIVCVGDSITAGYTLPESKMDGGYPARLAKIIPNAIVINDAHGGKTSIQLRGFLPSDPGADASAVLIQAGTNDFIRGQQHPVTIIGNLRELVEAAHEKFPGAQVYVSTIPPIGPKYNRIPVSEVTDLNRRIMGLKDCTPVNVGGSLGFSDLAADQVHPVPSGYDRLASLWAGFLTRNH